MIGEAALFVAAIAGSAVLTGIVTRILRNRAILDRPNARSSHNIPTPRGGGWGMMLALTPFWIWAGGRRLLDQPVQSLLIAGAILLMAVSWIDDRRGLGPAVRFAAQIVAVGAVMIALPEGESLTGGALPLALDRAAAALAWLWFVNLFNFMDGIDGIAGGSAAAMGIGVFLAWPDRGSVEAAQGAIIAATAIGFLVWNWAPAKVFMGDVGSIPIGYLLGFGLIRLAVAGEAVAALIIALYYLADATITLGRRLLRGERVWQAHREHFYQQSVRRGRSHAMTAGAAILVQAALVGLAVLSADYGAWMLLPAIVLVALLLVWMARPGWAP
jgi:UDP-N-acetylmuramyl pentapeptide phosphotransferase/UDP-N-acetylglucosamine-1-phosphate transferase